MEQPLLIAHSLALEKLDRVVDRISLLYDRHISVPGPFHLLFDSGRELIRHFDPAVNRAIEGVAERELYFDVNRVALLLHDVPDSLDEHHLGSPDIGIIPGIIFGRDKGDHTILFKPLVQLLHLAVEKYERDRIVVLLLILFHNTLKRGSFVILLDRSLDHYGRHRYPPCVYPPSVWF